MSRVLFDVANDTLVHRKGIGGNVFFELGFVVCWVVRAVDLMSFVDDLTVVVVL